MFNNKPDKRKKKVYEAWRININKYILQCNMLTNLKIYNRVK